MNKSKPFSLPRSLPSGFLLIEEIGQGGMGLVYRGLRTSDDEPVAVKMLHTADDPALTGRFMREVRILAGMESPHIVDVLSFGRTPEGEIFMVMEYLRGKNLDELLKGQGRLSTGQSGHIAKQIALALHAVHEAGIVHRDLKPGNVMLIERDDDPLFTKILDFGIAKHAGEGRSEYTATGVVMGTLSVMAPEQLLGSPVDARTDIYALGGLLYKMVTGTYPFGQGGKKNTVKQILREIPEKPSLRAPDAKIPAALDHLIGTCLQKDPDQRCANMEVVLAALADLGLPAPESLPAPPESLESLKAMSLKDAAALAFPETGDRTMETPFSPADLSHPDDITESGEVRVEDLLEDAAPRGGTLPSIVRQMVESTDVSADLPQMLQQSTEILVPDTDPVGSNLRRAAAWDPHGDTLISEKPKESLPNAHVQGPQKAVPKMRGRKKRNAQKSEK
jgi:serine/threonine protein kinase